MAIIKCKMCGGDLNVEENSQVAVCEYCGTQQTVPKQDNEKKLTLFARANRLRFACEFDKAAGVYESIVAEFPEEAEAYWGLVLCKYGIEYVDDPATGKKIPTCHRSSFDSVLEDANFELVMEYSDVVTRKLYREEAKAIEGLRRSIIEVSSREDPYDIFICYKETDENGQRTLDSVLAQDLYDTLTEKGYRVFFSRITLEDKLGQEYEPYIFAALNSARVMLAVGTDYEYYNAPWVKNEWSRYLQLIAAGQKKSLIPCYKNIDAYDMPKEFAKLQAQDLGKIGATQDLLRGIEKLFGTANNQKASQNVVPISAEPNIEPLLRRGQLFLEDRDWRNADDYFNKVLDLDPECAEAYLGKLLTLLRTTSVEHISCKDIILPDGFHALDELGDYKKAYRFGDDKIRSALQSIESAAKVKMTYELACEKMKSAHTYDEFKQLAETFKQLDTCYPEAKARAAECTERIDIFGDYEKQSALLAEQVEARRTLQNEVAEYEKAAFREIRTAQDICDSISFFHSKERQQKQNELDSLKQKLYAQRDEYSNRLAILDEQIEKTRAIISGIAKKLYLSENHALEGVAPTKLEQGDKIMCPLCSTIQPAARVKCFHCGVSFIKNDVDS